MNRLTTIINKYWYFCSINRAKEKLCNYLNKYWKDVLKTISDFLGKQLKIRITGLFCNMIKHIPQTKNQYLNQGGILDAYYQPLLLDFILEALARTINKEKQT